jgi:hypothetical protein
MGFATKAPSPGGEGGALDRLSFPGGNDNRLSTPPQKFQAPSSDRAVRGADAPFPRHLRLVAPRPQPRYEVRIAVSAARTPVGRSRTFHLAESDIDELIAIALRLEARRA